MTAVPDRIDPITSVTIRSRSGVPLAGDRNVNTSVARIPPRTIVTAPTTTVTNHPPPCLDVAHSRPKIAKNETVSPASRGRVGPNQTATS